LIKGYNENPAINPYRGWFGQGNYSDLHESRKDPKWKNARDYFEVQKRNASVETLVIELPAESQDRFTYIFDEVKVNRYWELHANERPE
jgi:hypothetical protein